MSSAGILLIHTKNQACPAHPAAAMGDHRQGCIIHPSAVPQALPAMLPFPGILQQLVAPSPKRGRGQCLSSHLVFVEVGVDPDQALVHLVTGLGVRDLQGTQVAHKSGFAPLQQNSSSFQGTINQNSQCTAGYCPSAVLLQVFPLHLPPAWPAGMTTPGVSRMDLKLCPNKI